MSSASNYRVTRHTVRTPTCDICKARHQKCSGAQPQCNNCELRGIDCTYSHNSLRRLGSGASSKASGLPSPQSSEATPRRRISDAEYDRIYSQIFGAIVRRFDLDENFNSDVSGETSASTTQRSNASLPSLYREVATMVREYAKLDSKQDFSHINKGNSSASQGKELALERDLEHSRKLLRDSLPSQDVAYRLLDLFFEYQNSVFYVCGRDKVQAQLNLMFENPDKVSISWFCQMFLIFAVGVQFDDMDDTDGATYHEIGFKHIDDAVEEDPQNSLWVIRAMLLLCFYQPPTKWSSIWIHFDAAIRGAQKFQLDLGQNMLKEVSNEEYQEWRQLWLTMISFDRWVAIFLGRLPRITESISRDPIFRNLRFEPNLDYCTIQNHITSLAIVSGYILRDMYFSEKYSLNSCQQRKNELEIWMSNLPNPLRQQVESGVIPNMPKDLAEAIFHLHFMQLGTWILLTRPSLLRAIKMSTSSTGFGGSISSAIASNARVCVNSAMKLIKSATMMLVVSTLPKRSFMPVHFLINAAHIAMLGALWKLKQSGNMSSPLINCDQSEELASIDEATRVLDSCGQRNVYARKYSSLVKGLRQELEKSLSTDVGDIAFLSSAASSTTYNHALAAFTTPAYSESTNESQNFQTVSPDLDSNSMMLLPGIDEYGPSTSSSDANIGMWSDSSAMFYLQNEVLENEQISALQGSHDLGFLDET